MCLFEPLAIARYIDEILSTKDSEDPLHLSLFPKSVDPHQRNYADLALLRVEVDQISALIVTRVQKTVEDCCVKPYFALRNNGASREDIAVALSENLQAAEEMLVMLERVIQQSQSQLHLVKPDYIFGASVTWADVFLFPILRDFKATESAVLQGGAQERLPWLSAWYARFEKRPSAQQTLATSFAGSA